MQSRGVLYGITLVFLTLLVISSSFALYYYGEEQQTASQNKKYVGELNAALTSYRSLSGSFNATLEDYRQTLSLLATAVANLNTSTPAYLNASTALSSLWGSYQALADDGGRKAPTYQVDVLVDFGNGTSRWYNDSSAQPGWNGYVVSLVLLNGNIQATWYPQYGEHFVTGIDGVSSSATTSWFVWNLGGNGWTFAPSGVDEIQVSNGTKIAWTLCPYDSSFNPVCRP